MSRKEKAITMRKQGYSYSDIAKSTGLAKSTLSYHLASIVFEPNEKTRLRLNLARINAALTKNKQKIDSLNKAKNDAAKLIKKVTDRDKLVAGVALYAGEGSKTLNLVRLVNANPRVARFFVDWLELLGVPRKHVYFRIHGYPDTDFVAAATFWRQALNLDILNMQKECVDKRNNKKLSRKGVHQYGTVHLTVKSLGNKEYGVALSRKIMALIDILFS